MGRLQDIKVAFFVEQGFEDLEFWVTVMRLREEGATVSVVAPVADREYRGKVALTATSDVAAVDVSADA